MSTDHPIQDAIDETAATVGSLWPIHSFVTANPLAGFEDQPFPDAVERAADLLGGRGYPRAETFELALERGQIDRDILTAKLAEAGYEDDPETLLDRMGDATAGTDEATTGTGAGAAGTDEATTGTASADVRSQDPDTAVAHVDRVLCKWLSTFLDEGTAHWSMPNRESGFYTAFQGVAAYDDEIPNARIVTDMPDTPIETIETVLEPYPEHHWTAIFEEQLTALPGWTGFIKQRAADEDVWQSTYPISIEGYLAVRLALLAALDADISPSIDEATSPTGDTELASSEADHPTDELAETFLSAWEATYRDDLVETVTSESRSMAATETADRPDAQLVFCIDTRSEIIRRHIETTGNYETHGYAGFFGIPMEYQGYDTDVSVDACPPIVDPQHHITDVPTTDDTHEQYDRWSSIGTAAAEVIEILEANAATAYGYVETAGSGYGLSLAARTLVPGRVRDLFEAAGEVVPDAHEFCEPLIHNADTDAADLPVGMTIEEQTDYAEAAFGLMGWTQFSRLVVFAGHASETANNPYAASLDCGACAGNPGGPNARILATICNTDAVRAKLRDRGYDIPDDTVFLAGQHNTTTDHIELYDDDVPATHAADLDRLRADLATARQHAAAERLETMGTDASIGSGESVDVDGTTAISETNRRAADWAETRPEWGLAGNAGFIIGPRELTRNVSLDGRAFLHSYDWSTDPDGDALEAIFTGPLVVTQWINTQYYFSTVDNAVYGGGSKITQNPVGNIGVYQGNGGDLMTGLPLQSLMAADDEPHHQPLRLSTVVHAPVDRVTDVLAANEDLMTLLDNDWLSLTVVDPTQGHCAFHYEEELEWAAASEQPHTIESSSIAPAVADD